VNSSRRGAHRRGILLASCAILTTACGGGGGPEGAAASDASAAATNAAMTAVATLRDITADVLANRDVTLAGAAVVKLPPGTTTYTGVISGQGTLRLTPSAGMGTLVITRASTFTLPPAQQVQVVKKTSYPGAGYALTIEGRNPPVLTIDPGVTFQIGTNTAADDAPNIIATSDSKNAASLINGEINLNNILNNGTLVLSSSKFVLLGQISGSGHIVQLPGVWGGNSPRGVSTFTGVLSLTTGHDFGSNHVAASFPNAKAILNEGSWLVWSPPGSVVTVPQNIYEAAYGNDINFHAIGPSTIVMAGVYSHTDNSPHNQPNLVDPGLSDPSLNFAKVIYRGGANDVNGNDGSYRGINIERGAGVVQWGDGTHANFFLPSAPSPAEPYPALGKKNAYINLRGGNLAFNYNGPVTLHVGITGGGGGPHRDGSVGNGNVTIMGTPGNDVTFAQPQNYNGTTTIGANAVLRLGTGTPVPLNYITVHATRGKSTFLQATYSGDAGLLTAESPNGLPSNAIVNDGQLIVQNTTTAITLSKVSGQGSLTHNGAAELTLQNNSYSGATMLNAGTTWAGSSNALGTGNVINNASLGLAGGQHELTVGGSFRQGSTGQLALAIAGTTPGINHGHLSVAGAAVLGGSLTLNFSGSYPKGQRLVLIEAAGGLSGTFRSITSNGASVVPGQDGNRFFVTVQ
jgi:autotransporter-associated beta strand protein